MDEQAPTCGVRGIGWELIVCCVDTGRVAKVVGVPREGRGSLGGVVDAMRTREWRVLREDAHGGKGKEQRGP